jgi:FkbM family methyltransferase
VNPEPERRRPVPVPPELRGLLGERLPEWLRAGRRAILVPAGNLARTLLEGGELAGLELLAVADSDRRLHGAAMGPHRVRALEELPCLGADLVLVASTRFHQELTRALRDLLGPAGPEVVDLCTGVSFRSVLAGMAAARGLELEERPGFLRVVRPGRPRKVIELDLRSRDFATGLVEHFDDLLGGEVPDRSDDEELLVRINRPKYRVFKESGVSLFSPCQTDNEANILALLRAADLREGEQVVDLGAYSGDTTYFFAKAVGPRGRVLAVEPDPESFAALERNVREQGLDNVATEPSAVWDQAGTIVFQSGGVTTSRVATDELSTRTVSVPTRTLEALLERHGFGRVDFLKMDIEGAEFTVLPQAREILRRLRPRMILEVHGEGTEPRTVAGVLAFLEEAGFRAWILQVEVGDSQALVQAEWAG